MPRAWVKQVDVAARSKQTTAKHWNGCHQRRGEATVAAGNTAVRGDPLHCTSSAPRTLSDRYEIKKREHVDGNTANQRATAPLAAPFGKPTATHTPGAAAPDPAECAQREKVLAGGDVAEISRTSRREHEWRIPGH